MDNKVGQSSEQNNISLLIEINELGVVKISLSIKGMLQQKQLVIRIGQFCQNFLDSWDHFIYIQGCENRSIEAKQQFGKLTELHELLVIQINLSAYEMNINKIKSHNRCLRFFTNITYSSEVTAGIYPFNKLQNFQGQPLIFNQYNIIIIALIMLFFELAKFNGLIQSRFFDPNEIDTHIEIKKISYSQNKILSEEIVIAQTIESISIIFYWQCIDQELLKIQLFCLEQCCPQTNIKCDIKKILTVRLQAKFLLNQNSQNYIKISKTSVSLSATQVIKQSNDYEKLLFKLEKLNRKIKKS
ncbi:unnamed protein product [Paramecium primaurelia]|uniref:Transmembrane protein n=1 Tax=Paramecium primaurelia TaxID=5886 RepID=A0A8S1P429_PARPR|nr:unnamed protein product [Paramecium primaurelia]